MRRVALKDCCIFDRSKQLDAASIQDLIESSGTVHLLPSSRDYDWVTTRKRAGKLLCHGPVIAMGKARYANIKYCEGDFVSSNNMLIKPKNPAVLDSRYLFYFLKRHSTQAYVEGTTYPKFDLGRFHEMHIPIPEMGKQRSIVTVFDLLAKQICDKERLLHLLDEQVKSLFIKRRAQAYA